MPNVYYGTDFDSFRYISHHGILGQKWGIRRFQNKDGSLTNAGKKRYSDSEQNSSNASAKIKKSSQGGSDPYEKIKSYKDITQKEKDDIKDHLINESVNKMEKNCATQEERDRKLRSWMSARDKDMWSIDFLEAVQNSTIAYEHDTKAMLNEYAKYLDDPNDYMVNQARKLKQA